MAAGVSVTDAAVDEGEKGEEDSDDADDTAASVDLATKRSMRLTRKLFEAVEERTLPKRVAHRKWRTLGKRPIDGVENCRHRRHRHRRHHRHHHLPLL